MFLFDFIIVGRRKGSSLHSAAGPLVTVEPSKSLTLLWGATGEQVKKTTTHIQNLMDELVVLLC